jgi:pilus assembly protein FimV
MHKLLRLFLWQVIVIGILSTHFPVKAEEDRGIRMRGPKSSDVFPYDRYGPITSKDTLWNIATRVRPDIRLSVYQVMEALYQKNPQSFLDNNMNHLVEGQYLEIPSFNTMMAVNTYKAKQKSEKDTKAWQKMQPKVVKKVVITEPSVNKKDLDTVKIEINDQLQKIDGEQQKRLTTIQNDISDSIDGLQTILKENGDLRQRLTSFNDKLGVMQNEVAKGKEIKLQMDDMIKLQQALLAKAEAREEQLLLEKQLAELAEQDITSSLWFIIVMGTMPAIFILGLLALLFRRRQQASDEVFFSELDSKKQVKTSKKEVEDEVVSLDDELDLGDDLSLDDELDLGDDLSLDDELDLGDDLSLDDELDLGDDLSLDDELDLGDDLSLDDELDLNDDLSLDDELDLDADLIENEDDDIQLDEDDNLDELDDLEDILLDEISDGGTLDGGSLDQSDLDSLLSGDDDSDVGVLEGGSLDQSDLDSLFSGGGEEDSSSETLEGGELSQDDLNDLLGGLNVVEDGADVTDPDDIDALLNAAAAPAIEDGADVTDPDDIDALLNAAAAPAVEDGADVTDPDDIDDIDALLNAAAAPAIEDGADVTDPDDIDALLNAASAPAIEDGADVTDPDDIDALLNAAAAPTIEDDADVTDPDDIDALLNAASAPAIEDGADVTDPDDIDALLNAAAAPTIEDDAVETPVVEAPIIEGVVDVTDPDDIDTLLDSVPSKVLATQSIENSNLDEKVSDSAIGIDEKHGNEHDKGLTEEEKQIQQEIAQNESKIAEFTTEYVTPFITADFSDIITQKSNVDLDLIDSNALVEDFDIDELAEDTVNNDDVAKISQGDEKEDIGDSLTDYHLDESDTHEEIELLPDFTDEDILAELLADTAESDTIRQEEGVIEIDSIEELDNVDFDELLANIEEESATSSKVAPDDIDTPLDDIGDSLIEAVNHPVVKDQVQSNIEENTEEIGDFVSVDDLLSDTLENVELSEPYEKTNIDVGLGQFAENHNGIDVDEDGSMSSKLDLAKMYIEMNDDENAEVILQDILFKGDATQQLEAQLLLDGL